MIPSSSLKTDDDLSEFFHLAFPMSFLLK